MTDFRLDDAGRLRLTFNADTNHYYLLLQGGSVMDIRQPAVISLASPGAATLSLTHLPPGSPSFYVIRSIPVNSPLDTDLDGIDDVYELRHQAFLDPLNSVDSAQDSNGNGKSNLQDYLDESTPPSDPGVDLTARMALGYLQAAVIADDGTLWAWNGSHPARIGADSDWLAVSIGGLTATTIYALKKDGSLWIREFASKFSLLASEPWTAVSAGFGHVLTLRADGTIWGGGDNSAGGLGGPPRISGQLPIVDFPTQVGTDSSWRSVVTSGNATFGIKSDHSLWRIVFTKASRVGGALLWKRFSGGGAHQVGIDTEGILWAWGDNDAGQLGDETVLDRSNPVRVHAEGEWQSATAGRNHSVAIKDDGSIWAWGTEFRQLSPPKRSLVPIQIGQASDWREVVAGQQHTLAVKRDGTVWYWAAADRVQNQVFGPSLGNGEVSGLFDTDPLPTQLQRENGKPLRIR